MTSLVTTRSSLVIFSEYESSMDCLWNLTPYLFWQHEREDWDAQEREFKRRVRERMRDLEPTQKGTTRSLKTLLFLVQSLIHVSFPKWEIQV